MCLATFVEFSNLARGLCLDERISLVSANLLINVSTQKNAAAKPLTPGKQGEDCLENIMLIIKDNAGIIFFRC